MQDDYSMETFFTFAAPNMMSDDNCCDCLDQMPLAMAYVLSRSLKIYLKTKTPRWITEHCLNSCTNRGTATVREGRAVVMDSGIYFFENQCTRICRLGNPNFSGHAPQQ